MNAGPWLYDMHGAYQSHVSITTQRHVCTIALLEDP